MSLGRVNTGRGEEKRTRRATRIAARDSFFAVFIFVKRSRRLPSPLSSPTRARRANFCGEQNRGRLVAAVMNRQLPYIRTPAVLRSIPPFFSFFSFFFPLLNVSQPPRATFARHAVTPINRRRTPVVISSSILRKIYDTPGRQFISPVIASQPLATVYTTGRFRPPRD